MNTIISIQLILSCILIVAVSLPFVRHDYWVFRILEYPRYQKLILCLVVLISLFFTIDYANTVQVVTLVLLSFCVVYLTIKIWPYTPFAQKEIYGIKPQNEQQQLKLFTANVYQENRDYAKIRSQITQYDPDIILLVETDKPWEKAMDVFIKDYPNCLKAPLGNTYGMLFYTRLQIISGSIRYLVENDLPSLEATLKLASGQPVKVWGLHPKPPVPGEDDRSTAKDKELMKVAFEVKKEKLPSIVMGDLNDVAWSYVTELFRKTSGLLDPRRGRGFYSTFSANYWFLRFPLDYVFCSAHFGLISMKRLTHNGSDHFAMFSHFEYREDLEKVQPKPVANAAEKEEAADKATQAV